MPAASLELTSKLLSQPVMSVVLNLKLGVSCVVKASCVAWEVSETWGWGDGGSCPLEWAKGHIPQKLLFVPGINLLSLCAWCEHGVREVRMGWGSELLWGLRWQGTLVPPADLPFHLSVVTLPDRLRLSVECHGRHCEQPLHELWVMSVIRPPQPDPEAPWSPSSVAASLTVGLCAEGCEGEREHTDPVSCMPKAEGSCTLGWTA